MALAGKDKALFYFFPFQCIIYVHAHLAAYQLCPAGTAYTSFAGIRKVGTLLQGCIQDI
jgi:hypothetical protein